MGIFLDPELVLALFKIVMGVISCKMVIEHPELEKLMKKLLA